MPNQHTARVEREQLQAPSAAQWQRERQGRVDAYAAVLTHLNAAAAAVPMGDGSGPPLFGEISFLAGNARGALRRVMDEPNPFVGTATDPGLRRLAENILRDAEAGGCGDWDAARMVAVFAGILTDDRRAALAQMINDVRS